MSTEIIVSKLLPLSLAIIMLGFGLTLTLDDFKRIALYPKPVLVGLACQMFIVPAMALGICYLFNFTPELSVGLMILAASPGGVTANLYSHLSHGDVALNLTLTAINSVLAAFTLPLIVNFALIHFGTGSEQIGLQFQKTIEVFLIVLIPVLLGMGIRKWKPAISQVMDKPVRIFSFIVLITVVVVAVANEKEKLNETLGQIGVAMLLFNLGSMMVGYLIPVMMKMHPRSATAISMEVGIHNSTLAIYIAMSVLGSFQLALPSAVYSIIMFFTAGVFGFYLSKKNRAGQ